MGVPEARLAGNVLATLLIAWVLLKSFRYIRANSRVLGRIVAAGILARAVLGLALFWISYLQLPIGSSLHSGDGFWQLAPDAQGYYELAISAASGTLAPDEPNPSPGFVSTLALWMSIVGISPAAAFLLNLTLYVFLIALVVWYYRPVNDWRRDLPCLIGVAAYSFSPALLLHSSQPLKDGYSSALLATGCLGVLGLRTLIYSGREQTPRALSIAMGVLFVATYGMAGVRWYYAAMMVCAVAVVLTVFAFYERSTPLRPYLAGCAALLLAMSTGFVIGIGPAYREYLGGLVFGSAGVHNVIGGARTGFLTTGGATSIGDIGRDHALSVGMAFMFVPISVITAVSDISIEGGRGLLPIVDADTVFQDLGIASIVFLLWKRRRAIDTGLPLVVFGTMLGVTSALLIAYIVTNIGTQWRLRLLVTVPLWFLGMGISARRSGEAAGTDY
jgi:hypothetical protein